MKKYGFWLILIIICALRIYLYFENQIHYPNNTKLRITSRVTSEPIRYTNSQYISLKGFKVYLPHYPEVYYGDKVVVEGKVQDRQLKEAKLIRLEEATGFFYNLRKNLNNFYYLSLPQPHSALVAGVTLGSKGSIPTDFWKSLKKSGTTHVVVASGMNVTLVSQFLISFLSLILARRRAIPFAIAGILIYALLSGFDAPIIRASIMGSLVFIAQELGRLSFSLRTLFLTIFVMLFIKPDWITDVGFQLSFVATLSLILFEPKLDKWFQKLPSLIRKDFSTSLAAQIGVAPILFVTFGQFNVLSPIVNIAVLWTIVPMTVIGMVGGLAGLIYQPVGRIVLLLTYPLTSWFIFIVSRFQ